MRLSRERIGASGNTDVDGARRAIGPGLRPGLRRSNHAGITVRCRQNGGQIKSESRSDKTRTAVKCGQILHAIAVLMLAGSPTNGFAADELWGAFAKYEYFWPHDRGEYEGYGVAVNAPSMPEALTKAVERCQEEEQKVPAYVRDDPEALFVPRAKRCDGTNFHGPNRSDSNRRVFSTSVPENPGVIHDVFPGVHALHGQCIVIWLLGHVDSERRSFGFYITNDATAHVEEEREYYNSHTQFEGQVDSISCNDQ